MHMTHPSQHLTHAHRQNGAALLIGLLILVVMTLMTVFAVNIGVFEQRSSRNELRAGESFRAAESGIAAGLEFFKANQRDVADGTSATGWFTAGNLRWTPCAADPAETDPCHAQYIDPFLAPAGAYRGTVYKYLVGDSHLIDLPDALEMVDAALDHDVMALLCFYHADTNTCRPQNNATNDLIVQFTSIGRADISEGLAGGSSQATVSQVFAPFRLVAGEVASPVVANSFSATGNLDIVANPNGGGDGVPVSIWSSNEAIPSGGNAKTCNQAEFYAQGTVADDGITCDSCACPNLGGNVDTDDMIWVPLTEGDHGGEDIVEHAADFPSDLFRYVFSYPSSQWKEVKIKAQSSGLVVANCDGLDATTEGLVWVTGDCNLGSGDIVSSPTAPMLMVVGCGAFKMKSGAKSYGLVYVPQASPFEEGCTPEASIVGGSKLYGALVVDGTVGDGSGGGGGTPSIVYNLEVLRKLAEDPNFSAWGPIPGTWRDYAQN